MKSILLVADEPGWVFERHCKEIQDRLTEYHIDIAYHRQNIPELSKKYDCVYVCDPMPMLYPPANKTIMGLRNEFLYREHPNGAKGLYKDGFPGRCVSIKDKCCIFHVVNKNLMNVFKDVVIDKPLILVQHGVDENVFDKEKYQREKHDGIRISGAGRNSPNKGFGIIKKACNELNIKCITAKYGKNKLSKNKMPEFYMQVDVHVCMSKTEGLNNTVLEAGAMGIPVISTRSGAAEEIIRDGKNGYLIERDVQSLISAIRKLENVKLRETMGQELYIEIMNNWKWASRIEDFRKMFNLYFKEQK